MKKIIIYLLVVVIAALIVSAVDYVILNPNITPVKIDKPIYVEPKDDNTKIIYFTCGKDIEMEGNINEPDNKIDKQDITTALSPLCKDDITNIRDKNGNILKQNENGLYSFDEEELILDSCTSKGGTIDVKSGECTKPIYEEKIEEPIKNPFEDSPTEIINEEIKTENEP